MADTLLDIRHLTIDATAYPPGEAPQEITIVDDVSFTLERGKVLGLIGESGAGKSTIGLSPAGYGRGGIRLSGEVWVNGRDILKDTPKALRKLRGRTVCYVAQSAAAAFNPAHTLMEQVIETTLLHGLATRQEAEARAVELFGQLGLPDPGHFGSRYPHQVSGGQLQRAMTAMALCPKPDLIIFDEPTTALDVTTQIDVLAAIKRAIHTTGGWRALHYSRSRRGRTSRGRHSRAAPGRESRNGQHGTDHRVAPGSLYTSAGRGTFHRAYAKTAFTYAATSGRGCQRGLSSERPQCVGDDLSVGERRPDAGHRGRVRVG